MTTILKGNIVSAPACGRLDVTEHGYLIAENGVITGVYPVLPEQYAGASVEDYGDCLIVQSFADLHLHVHPGGTGFSRPCPKGGRAGGVYFNFGRSRQRENHPPAGPYPPAKPKNGRWRGG